MSVLVRVEPAPNRGMLEYEEADVPRIEGELTIRRPVDVVFDVVADQRHEPQFNPDMRSVVMTTPEPVGQVSRFVATTMTRGRPVKMTIEFTEWERPSRLASRDGTLGLRIPNRNGGRLPGRQTSNARHGALSRR